MQTTGKPLDTLFGQHSVTLASGVEVAIKKVHMKNLKQVLDALHGVVDTLQITNGVSAVVLSDPKFILQLISSNVEVVYGLAVMHCSLTLEELMELEVDEGVLVIAAIVKLNVDFFTTKVMPLLTSLASPAKS